MKPIIPNKYAAVKRGEINSLLNGNQFYLNMYTGSVVVREGLRFTVGKTKYGTYDGGDGYKRLDSNDVSRHTSFGW